MNNYLVQKQFIDYEHFTGSDSQLSGCIREIYYRSESPRLLTAMLLPLLQLLAHQSRWQLWLSPQAKISRKWLTEAGLPITKSVQLTCTGQAQNIDATLRALASGNFSIVVTWLVQAPTQNERTSLELAATEGQCTAIILLPETHLVTAQRQENQTLIPSNVLH